MVSSVESTERAARKFGRQQPISERSSPIPYARVLTNDRALQEVSSVYIALGKCGSEPHLPRAIYTLLSATHTLFYCKWSPKRKPKQKRLTVHVNSMPATINA